MTWRGNEREGGLYILILNFLFLLIIKDIIITLNGEVTGHSHFHWYSHLTSAAKQIKQLEYGGFWWRGIFWGFQKISKNIIGSRVNWDDYRKIRGIIFGCIYER